MSMTQAEINTLDEAPDRASFPAGSMTVGDLCRHLQGVDQSLMVTVLGSPVTEESMGEDIAHTFKINPAAKSESGYSWTGRDIH